jgi:hypothetical protein
MSCRWGKQERDLVKESGGKKQPKSGKSGTFSRRRKQERGARVITPARAPKEFDIRALEERCPKILQCLEGFAAPWVIEFAGSPRSGKSGCIATIEHLLRRNNFAVLAPREGAGNVPERLAHDLVAYNAWTATYAIQQILVGSARSEKDRYYNVVILDRGLFDATAWFHLLERNGKLDKKQRRLWTQFLRSRRWSGLLKQVFFFYCREKTSMRRELEGKLSNKHGRVLSADFLGPLRTAYQQALDCYKDDFEINRITTDSVSTQSVAYAVAKTMFDSIEQAAQGK